MRVARHIGVVVQQGIVRLLRVLLAERVHLRLQIGGVLHQPHVRVPGILQVAGRGLQPRRQIRMLFFEALDKSLGLIAHLQFRMRAPQHQQMALNLSGLRGFGLDRPVRAQEHHHV